MSRPFSYNDENFTVIGNMLFIHIFITESIGDNDLIVDIPPEINKRLLSDTIVCMYEGTNKNLNVFYGVHKFAREGNTLVASGPITPYELLKAIEPLKDI